ncbi:DoxX family protein [Mucilaginibacter flavus]|uniref:DoxX family protein n=1 Tax=Mucilaginibacter flavus TaxID=931504 RepID=UPI0025B576E5|nr:DoxX family protein [Mucilaginibacter flavus]MDN3579757.1 DoxX family protein [Mucilaginibacter flavus]
MKPKSVKITYWILTILFALAMAGDAYGGITKQQAGVDVLKHLGYPIYFMVFTGFAKLLGVIAILQTKFKTIKEWAYAGFAFTFLGAIASRGFVGDPLSQLIPPVVVLIILFITYYFWKKFDQLKATE